MFIICAVKGPLLWSNDFSGSSMYKNDQTKKTNNHQSSTSKSCDSIILKLSKCI